jgi:hypothetical protein
LILSLDGTEIEKEPQYWVPLKIESNYEAAKKLKSKKSW